MSTLPDPSPAQDYCSIFSESKRIAHHRHFHGLSVLFLLPISFFCSVYFTLQNLLTSSQIRHHSQSLLRLYSPTTNSTVFIILPLIYYVLALFLFLSAVGSISFSVYHGFFGHPVKLISSILSLRRSFLPLLFTYLSSLLIQSLICFTFGLFLYLVIKGFEFLGFEIEQSSPNFLSSCFVVGVAMILVLVYLQVNWALAYVIVVVESSWGFEPLRRSAKLIKGMRGITLSLMLFYGVCGGSWLFCCWFLSNGFDGNIRSWNSWLFVYIIVTSTYIVMLVMLQYIISNAVLYMSCKAVHGETAEKFAGEYVTLPFDDGKVNRIVPVIPTSELGLP